MLLNIYKDKYDLEFVMICYIIMMIYGNFCSMIKIINAHLEGLELSLALHQLNLFAVLVEVLPQVKQFFTLLLSYLMPKCINE